MPVTLAVVIPTCNRPDHLEATLRSVGEQSRVPEEILLINNGSAPVTLPPDAPAGVRVVEIMPFAGVAQARNFGVCLSRSDFIAFLDDDDLWETDYLRKMEAMIEQHQPDALLARLDALEGETLRPYKNPHGNLTPERLLVENPGVTGSNTVVRRTSFLQVGGYDPRLPASEDKSLLLELLYGGLHVLTVPDARAVIRQHPGARLSTDNGKMIEGISRFLDKYAPRMTPAQIRRNRLKIARFRHRRDRSPASLLALLGHKLLRLFSPGG